jgi:hypothetical protein
MGLGMRPKRQTSAQRVEHILADSEHGARPVFDGITKLTFSASC